MANIIRMPNVSTHHQSGKVFYSVSSIRLWNSLPDDIKRKNSLSSFTNALIAYFRDSYIDIDNFEALL